MCLEDFPGTKGVRGLVGGGYPRFFHPPPPKKKSWVKLYQEKLAFCNLLYKVVTSGIIFLIWRSYPSHRKMFGTLSPLTMPLLCNVVSKNGTVLVPMEYKNSHIYWNPKLCSCKGYWVHGSPSCNTMGVGWGHFLYFFSLPQSPPPPSKQQQQKTLEWSDTN